MHTITKCKTVKLEIENTGLDAPNDLELLAEELAELSRMNKGEFDLPPWDNCKKNAIEYTLRQVRDIVDNLARKNGINLG